MKSTRHSSEPGMLLDIASHARRGPGRRDRLSPAEVAQISRTVRRVPEAVVKVLTKDSHKLRSIRRHIEYIGRNGDLELETDDGQALQGKGIGRQVVQDWDLDLDEHRPQSELASARGRKPPKLIHKLLLSMPPGTPADGVLMAARNLLREEFALRHRYAFVLHTDEPHPHVHVVVKAVSEQGVRLNIKKATLREWRREFARHLRAQGIEANATELAVRGQGRTHKLDGIYRADRRGASTHTREKAETVARELLEGNLRIERGKLALFRTREEIKRGWLAVSRILVTQGQPELAAHIGRFVEEMLPPRTEKELLAAALVEQTRESRAVERLTTR